MEDQFSLDQLINQLQIIDNLRQRLLYVKWDRESFAPLIEALQNTRRLVQDQPAYGRFNELIAKLDPFLGRYSNTQQLPQGAERKQMLAVVEALCRTAELSPEVAPLVGYAPPTTRPGKGEIVVLAGTDAGAWVTTLREQGFRVSHLTSAAEFRARFTEGLPRAAIVDMDFPQGAVFASRHMMAQDSDHLQVPLLFLSERGDLAARLEAVSAGGTAYGVKPVSAGTVLDRLNDQWLRETARDHRVLLIAGNPVDTQKVTAGLASLGITTQVVAQPLETLQAVHRLQPDLILLDMDLTGLDGLELLKALRQQTAFADLPVLAYSLHGEAGRQLAVLEAGGDYLLNKSLFASHLLPTVLNALRRRLAWSRQLDQLGQRDTLSGLYHRRFFLERLKESVEDGRDPVAVLVITLDNLRAVEAQDIAAADVVLAQAAHRLRGALDTGQTAARIGDATFAVLSTITEQQTLLAAARAIRAALEADTYAVGEQFMQLRVSLGISLSRPERGDYRELLQQAHQACSSAWVARRDRILIFDPVTEPVSEVPQHQQLLDEIREALEQRRLRLVFQPIANLRGELQDRYEVWLRIRNQDGLELLPETVFSATHRHGLGIRLDRWVIARALRLLQDRQAQGQVTTLFINISPALLHDKDFAGWLEQSLGKTQVPAKGLVFEMAESTAAQHFQALRKFLSQVRPLGCGFSLDRFGNSEHSVALLKGLGVNYAKVDPHLTRDLASSPEKQQQLKDLTQQLHAFQVTVVASNIEDLSTLSILTACGVEYVQGFSLQRPREEMSYNFNGDLNSTVEIRPSPSLP